MSAILATATSAAEPQAYPNTTPILVKHKGKCGYVDTKGKFVIPPKFDPAMGFDILGLAAIGKADRTEFIDVKGRVQFATPKGTQSYGFRGDDFAQFSGDANSAGFIDRSGKLVIVGDWGFADGFHGRPFSAVYKDGKYGLIDRKGNYVVQAEYDSIKQSGLGTALGRRDGKLFLISATGAVTEEKMDIPFLEPNGSRVIITAQNQIVAAEKFQPRGFGEWFNKAGYGIASINDYVATSSALPMIWRFPDYEGIVDSQNNWVIPPEYDFILLGEDISNMSAVKDGKSGILNVLTKKFTPEEEFEYNPDYDGRSVALVEKGGKWGLLDRQRKWIVQPKFEGSSCGPYPSQNM
jgi:hypothetical protein